MPPVTCYWTRARAWNARVNMIVNMSIDCQFRGAVNHPWQSLCYRRTSTPGELCATVWATVASVLQVNYAAQWFIRGRVSATVAPVLQVNCALQWFIHVRVCSTVAPVLQVNYALQWFIRGRVWATVAPVLQRRVALAPAQLVCLGVQLLLDRTTDSLLGKTAARWCACMT